MDSYNINIAQYLPPCAPEKEDIEISIKTTYTDASGNRVIYDLVTDFDFLEIGNISIKKDIGKVSELTFELLEKKQAPVDQPTPSVFNEISVEYINHKTAKISNTFFGYIIEKKEKSRSNSPYKVFSIRCVGYEKALYDTIIVETWNNLSAKEIIEKVWKERLEGTNNYNFPAPNIDPALTETLGKITHEDSIERILEILATRTDSVWWFDDKSVLHFTKKTTLIANVEYLKWNDYNRSITPINWSESLVKYANQVKFKAKDVRGNSDMRVFEHISKNGEYNVDTSKFHSFLVVTDGNGVVYKEVKSIDKTSNLHQFVVSGEKITFFPQPATGKIEAWVYYKYNTVVVQDNIAEQSRLKNFMKIGYIISKDITNERLKTIQQIRDYCGEYLKHSVKPTYTSDFIMHSLTGNQSLSRWGFDKKAYNFKYMEYVVTDELCETSAQFYPDVSLELVSKTITLAKKHSRLRRKQVYDYKTKAFIEKNVPTLSNEDFIIKNSFVDGLRDVWEDRFKRDKRQIYEQDLSDKDIHEVNISQNVAFDIIADELTVDGTLVPVNDTTLTKSRETNSVTDAMGA